MADNFYTEIFKNPEFSQARKNTPMRADNVEFSPWRTSLGIPYLSAFSDEYSRFWTSFENTAVAGAIAKASIGIYDWANDSKVHSKEEFESVGMTVDKPMTMTEAMYLQERSARKQVDEIIQGNLKKDSIRSDLVLPFVSGMAGDITGNYPLYLLGGKLASKAISTVGPRIVGAGAAASITEFFSSNVVTRSAGAGLTEALGAAIVENPADWAVRTQLYGERYTMKDGLENIAYSFLGGAFFGMVGEGFSKVLQKRMDAASKGKKANDTPQRVVDRLQYGDKQGATKPVSFEGKVFSAHNTTTRVLGPESQRYFGSTFGREGIVLTTSEEIGKRFSKNNRLDIHGQMASFDLKSVNLLDGDQVIPKDLEIKLSKVLREHLGEDADKILAESRLNSETVKELSQRINKEALRRDNKPLSEALNNVVSREGFDGYSFLHRNSVGKPVGGEGATAIHLFDKSKISEPEIEDFSGLDRSDPRIENQRYDETIEEDLNYYESEKSEIFYDEESYTRLDGTKPNYTNKPDYDLREFDSDIEEIIKDIDITNADIVTNAFKEAGAVAKDLESEFDISSVYEVMDRFSKDEKILFHGGTAPNIEVYTARGTTDAGYYGVGLMGSPTLSYTSSYRKLDGKGILGGVLGFKVKDGVKIYRSGFDGAKDLKSYKKFVKNYEAKVDSLGLTPETREILNTAISQYKDHINKIPYINYEKTFFRNPLNILLDVRPESFQTGSNVYPRDIRSQIPKQDHAKLRELQTYKSLDLLKESFDADGMVNKRGDEVIVWGRSNFDEMVEAVDLPDLDEAARVIGGTLQNIRQNPELLANIELARNIRERMDEIANSPKPEEVRQTAKESIFCHRG